MKAGTSIITLVEDLGLHQVVEEALAGDVERYARTVGGPDAADRAQEFGASRTASAAAGTP
jgi:hypothetical protein